MNEPQRPPSLTAVGVAALRAAHQRLDGEPKVLDDPIAPLIADDSYRRMLDGGLLDPATDRLAGLRAHVVLRSRYAEDKLREAVESGTAQLVILGAGLDTFAWRQPPWAQALRIFEVDHPGSQADKRRRLEQAGLPLPGNLDFVAIDFETTSLKDGLAASALDFTRPAFFICLGVLMYLTAEAGDAVFELVSGFPEGSGIAFSFAPLAARHSPLADGARAAGEPWQSFHDPDTLAHDLGRMGFTQVEFLSREEAVRTYFNNRSDGLAAPGRVSIGVARV